MFNGNLRTLFITVYIFTIMALSACQPESLATAAPPSPTIAFTIQPAQTQLTTSATPIPTANFVPEDLLGIWTRSDLDRGTLFLVFNENGTYVAAHGRPDAIVHSGDYLFDGKVFTFFNGWDCDDMSGVYAFRITGGGKYLLLEPLNDNCPDRPAALKGYRWDRVEATPTP